MATYGKTWWGKKWLETFDGISNGSNYVIFALMQHLEPAGIHSGDSSCAIRPFNLSKEAKNTILRITDILITELNIKGFFNIQFAVCDKQNVYILEVNPRASRTLPFISKALSIPVIEHGINAILRGDLPGKNFITNNISKIFIKMPIFSFNKIPECVPQIGVLMRSTGEVMASGDTMEDAILKAQLSDPHYNISHIRKHKFTINKLQSNLK
jgi:carbamoyl-phosphate synthase large subunit